jgi:RNA polymerase sigma-70 factor, ECF subfamily
MNPARPGELAARLAHGDEGALGDLYDAYGSALYSLACAITGSETAAERVLTLVFQHAWRDSSFRRLVGTSLFAQLVALTRTIALQQGRPGQRTASSWETRRARESFRGDDVLTPSRASVQDALDELTETQRSVIGQAFLGGRSVHEIAADLRESEGCVAQHLRSAMDGLRAALSPVAGTLEEQVITRV